LKVIAFNGSPRKDGNTFRLLQRVLEQLKKQGLETELIQLGGQPLRGCQACGRCRINKNSQCVIGGDPINEYIAKIAAAEGIILGSPTYFGSLTTETKAFIDRVGYVARGNGGLLRRKVGAAVAVARRAGALNVFNTINDFFLINEMIVPGSAYWNLALGREEGDVESDAEGLKVMDILGENMGWLLEKIKG